VLTGRKGSNCPLFLFLEFLLSLTMLKFVITDAFKITLLYAPLTPNPPQREPKSNSIVFFFLSFFLFVMILVMTALVPVYEFRCHRRDRLIPI